MRQLPLLLIPLLLVVLVMAYTTGSLRNEPTLEIKSESLFFTKIKEIGRNSIGKRLFRNVILTSDYLNTSRDFDVMLLYKPMNTI